MVIYEYQVEPVISVGEQIFFYQISPIYDVLFFLLGMVPTLWMPTHCYKPSHFSWWVMYLTVVMPSCIEAPHMISGDLKAWPMLIALVICFCLLMQVSRFKPLKLPRFNLPPKVFWAVAIVFTLVTFAALVASYGMPEGGLSFGAAHALRAAFKEKSKDVPLIIRYLFRWDAEVVLPCFVAYGAVRRKWLPILAGCFGELMMFLLTTFREFALVPVVMIAVAVWLWTFKRNNGTALVTLFAVISGIMAWATTLKESLEFVTMLFFDRFLLIGGQVTAIYYDYFTTHPPALYGSSFGQLFVSTPPYKTDIGIVIGNYYYLSGSSTTATNAPAHFWADAFGNGLWPGMFIAQILAMGIYWVIDSAFNGLDKRGAVLMGVMTALSITTEGLQSAVLTGGLIPLIFVGLMAGKTLRPYDRPRRKIRWLPKPDPGTPPAGAQPADALG